MLSNKNCHIYIYIYMFILPVHPSSFLTLTFAPLIINNLVDTMSPNVMANIKGVRPLGSIFSS